MLTDATLREQLAAMAPHGLSFRWRTEQIVEIKTKLPHLQLDVLLEDRLPPEHVDQVQGALWITGREWVDFVSYCRGLPLFVKRVHRDEDRIARIAVAVQEFNAELEQLMARITGARKAA